MSERINCVSHCRVCNQHFSGDSAFFAHLQNEDGLARKTHIDCLESDEFVPATEDGICELALGRGPFPENFIGGPLKDIIVWGEAKNRTEAKLAAYAALTASRGKS